MKTLKFDKETTGKIVVNWSKKEKTLQKLEKIEKLAYLESLYPVPDDTKITSIQAVKFDSLPQKVQNSRLRKLLAEGKKEVPEYVNIDVSNTYKNTSDAGKIDYLITSNKLDTSEVIKVGEARILSFYEFFKDFATGDDLITWIHSERNKAETAISEAESRTESESETESETEETEPQK